MFFSGVVLTRCFKHLVQLFSMHVIKRMNVRILGVQNKESQIHRHLPGKTRPAQERGINLQYLSLLKRDGLNRYEFEKTMTMSIGYVTA
jgi:hypothetical protein